MDQVRAFLPLAFFQMISPLGVEVLNGNAMTVRAVAAKRGDGSILRSREYLLFGFGMATVALQAKELASEGTLGYVVDLKKKRDRRKVEYWEIQSAPGAAALGLGTTTYHLNVSSIPPNPNSCSIIPLIEQRGRPGQFIYLQSGIYRGWNANVPQVWHSRPWPVDFREEDELT